MSDIFFSKDPYNINELFLAYKRNSDDEEAKNRFFRSLDRLSFDVAMHLYPSKHDRSNNQTDIYVLMRDYSKSYKGTEFYDCVKTHIRESYSRPAFFN